MSRCQGCGETVQFRFVDGMVRPLGCRCGGSTYGAPLTGIFRSLAEAHHLDGPWRAGPGSFTWPVTYRTPCFFCGEPVYYHTNGNGDCVLLDALGPPWPVHSCWIAHRERRREALVWAGRWLGTIALLPTLTSTIDRCSLEASVPPDAWHQIEAVTSLLEVVRARREVPVADLQYALNQDSRLRAFVLASFVDSEPRRPIGGPKLTIGGRHIQVFDSRLGLRLYAPAQLAEDLKLGDPFLAEGELFGLFDGQQIHLIERILYAHGVTRRIPTSLLAAFRTAHTQPVSEG